MVINPKVGMAVGIVIGTSDKPKKAIITHITQFGGLLTLRIVGTGETLKVKATQVAPWGGEPKRLKGLLGRLVSKGFTLTSAKQALVIYSGSRETPKGELVLYQMSIHTVPSAVPLDERELVLAELYGNTVSKKTGKTGAKKLLGSWKTINGANEGLLRVLRT